MASTSATASGSGSSSTRQPLSGEQQEQVIKQRMQVDERSLRRLVKKLTLLLSARDAESVASARLSFQADLEAFSLQLLRLSSIARTTSQVEIESYSQELREIQEEEHKTQSRIEALKRKLNDVRRERKNKLEYDVVASEVVKLPTRGELEEGMGRLEEGLGEVRGEKGKYAGLAEGAAERMAELVKGLAELRELVGFEVGERERREVERADGDAEGDGDATAAATDGKEDEEAQRRGGVAGSQVRV